jgi:hypothetical protein
MQAPSIASSLRCKSRKYAESDESKEQRECDDKNELLRRGLRLLIFGILPKINIANYSTNKKMTIMNDKKFLKNVLQTLQDDQLVVWLFGGWAEELHGLSVPRPHGDVDLLCPAPDFRKIDSFLQSNAG